METEVLIKTTHAVVVIGSLLLLVACAGQEPPVPIGASATASAPPLPTLVHEGGVIAFTSERDGEGDIYIMNADGSDLQRLTDDPAYDSWPTWSPDGLQIAFVSTRSGNADVYVMDADGSNGRQLTRHSAEDFPRQQVPR